MSPLGSALEEEPFITNSPLQGKAVSAQESDAESDEDEGDVSVKKKFAEISRQCKNGRYDLRDAGVLRYFVARCGDYFDKKTTVDSDSKTLLHQLVDDAKDKYFENYETLIKYLINNHPKLLKEKDGTDKTALYVAVAKRREKVIRLICQTYPNIDTILGIPCYHAENCIHVAIRRSVKPALAVFLIKYASEATLCARVSIGNTPLHSAVDYDRCTDAQLEIVKALVMQCDKAMSVRTDPPDSFSPYRYHEHTRIAAKKAAEAESKKAAKEKEKEAIGGKRDEGNVAGYERQGGKSVAGTKFKALPPAKDVQKPVITSQGPGGAPLSKELEKPRFSGLGNANSEVLLRKFEAPGRSNSEYGGLRFKDAPGSASAEQPNIEVDTSAEMVGVRSSDLKGLTPKTPVASKETRRKEIDKEEAKPTEESAGNIRDYLKLHALRTRNHDDAVDFLYGRKQEKQIYFDLYETASLTINEERIEEGLAHIKFDDILQYVALPSMQLEKKPTTSKLLRSHAKPPGGKGRNDMVFLFKFLRKHGVRQVIRVIVDDTLDPAHSDEQIEIALGGLKVEIWDWRKYDLCSETIVAAAPDAVDVSLYWKGNNAVLRGWSEPSGLNLLGQLKKVNLHVEQGLETTKRTQKNIDDFRERLRKLRPDVKLVVVEEHQPEKHDPINGPSETVTDQVDRHKWLICMDDFADFVQNVDPPLPLREQITVALIDDGVDINEQSLHAKIIGGRSFCLRDKFQNLNKPYYVTSGGHGTVMASLICRVCPKAQLYVLKLDEHMGENSKRQITAESAAKAIRAAIDKEVHIISMSWTIERTPRNKDAIENLESAIEAAAKAGILMFCAANDQGIARDDSFPAACGRTKHIFKIGAAEASGAAWKWTGDLTDVDFIFPGHNVIKERPNDAPLEKCKILTGSSVATAIGAGLAALVLYCVQLGALNTQSLIQQQQEQGGSGVTMDDFEAMKTHERMKEAFNAIGTSQASGHKYVEVWNVFEPATKVEGVDRDRRIKIVAGVAEKLTSTKTLQIK